LNRCRTAKEYGGNLAARKGGDSLMPAMSLPSLMEQGSLNQG